MKDLRSRIIKAKTATLITDNGLILKGRLHVHSVIHKFTGLDGFGIEFCDVVEEPKKKVNLPKKNAGRRLAGILKDLGRQQPTRDLLSVLNGEYVEPKKKGVKNGKG